MSSQTRRRLRAEHAPSGTLVLGTHYVAPSAGRIVYSDGRWSFRAEFPDSLDVSPDSSIAALC